MEKDVEERFQSMENRLERIETGTQALIDLFTSAKVGAKFFVFVVKIVKAVFWVLSGISFIWACAYAWKNGMPPPIFRLDP